MRVCKEKGLEIKVHYQTPLHRHKIFLDQFKDISLNKNVVMDGRDIATKVMPNADLKFFITADVKIRAKRRYDELKTSDKSLTFSEVLYNLNERDNDDVNREINPLTKSKDAIVIDNTSLNFAQQNELIFNYIHNVTT